MNETRGRDPYLELLGLIRSQAAGEIPLHVCLGEVLSYDGPGDILGRADGHELDAEDLWIADELKCDFSGSRMLNGISAVRFSGHATCGPYQHSWFDIKSLSSPMRAVTGPDPDNPRLKKGDIVLLIPDRERQTYFLICKVVRP